MSDSVYAEPAPVAWRRWQPAPLPVQRADARGATVTAHQSAQTSPHHDTNADAGASANANAECAELARLRECAQQRGYKQGYQEGHEQGLEEGTQAGHQAGHCAGYEEGLGQGRSAGEAQAQDQVRRLEYLADRCAQALSALETETGPQLVALALRIASQVLQSTLTARPEHLNDLVGQILRLDTGADDQALLTLRIHPTDETVLRPYLEQNPPGRRWRIMPDSTLKPGDCIAETAAGSIDATLATRWERATSSLGHDLSWPAQARHAQN